MDLSSFLELDKAVLHFFNGSDNLFLDNVTIVLTSGYTWIPLYLVLLYLVIKNNETMGQIMLIVGCSLLAIILADGMADYIVKPLVARWRPTNDPYFRQAVDTVCGYRGDSYGFFSAHAANTMSIAVFFCLLVRNRLLSVMMLLWSVLNGWTRLYLGVHYPSDVLVGWMWGAVAGVIAYFVYYKVYFKISPKLNYVSSQYTSTGYSLADVDVTMTVMVLILIYAILRGITLS